MNAHPTAQTTGPAFATTLSFREWMALYALHARYRQSRDLFSECETARLRFVRWLYRTGRIVP